MQVLVSTGTLSGGPYTNIGQLPASTSQVERGILLPLGAKFVKLQTTGTAYSVDAVTYPSYVCVTPQSTTCPTGQQSVGVVMGAVTLRVRR
ncbi:hypothetical protein GO730_04010 [Spirosoma sp. HMF3257]|uniref:Uncharacterized protein n=1 Tax=Spirosoma telluris TaxID=2183553 RepID=A0A327NIJ8_9BACT|nr:hypothetical protein [Spirosoma telluris]RAI73764.1 hypothetical protein HMF3257_03950 [Spirosoma telluris]